METITLGLDIGHYSIKGHRALKGMNLTNSFEKRVKRDQGSDSFHPLSESQKNALRELVAEGKIKKTDSVAVSLPGHLISNREIVLPFTDSQKIKKTLYYEAESQLPFNLEETVLGYQTLPGQAGSTRVLVFAAPKEMLKDYLDELVAIGIDPVHVCIDQIALYYYFSASTLSGNKNNNGKQFIMDMGASKTVLCGIQKGQLDWTRSAPIGTDSLIELLRDELALSWDQAEDLFINLDQLSPLQKKAIQVISVGLAPWQSDMEVSLTKSDPSSLIPIHLCGGVQNSLIKLLSKLLHREVMIHSDQHVQPESLLDSIQTATFAQAIGLTLLPSDAINFRQQEFTHSKEKLHGSWFVGIGISLLLLVILAAVDFYFHTLTRERQFSQLKKTLALSFQNRFPEIQNPIDPVKQAETAIVDIRQRSDLLGIGFDSPLLLLKKITDAIPSGIKIYVTEFSVEGRRVRIEAQTTSFDSVDKIKSALMKVESFEAVSVSDAKVSDDPGRIGFRIQITLKTTKEVPPSRVTNPARDK